MMKAPNRPTIVYTEEGMRDGLQIESAAISIDDKVALLDALSDTGLQRIVVGSFVSPRYTPQMARIDELMQKFKPRPGVTFLALALNDRGVERQKQYVPPLTIERTNGWTRGRPKLFCTMCDVFIRRNTNRSQMDEMSRWAATIAAAKERGATEAGISVNAVFGSNFVGEFSVDDVMKFLEKQHELWDAVGIPVTEVSVGDPMGWCHPVKMEQIFTRIKKKWPAIKDFGAHLHNARGMAMASTYAAIQSLEEGDILRLEGTIGGIGGCPYCGTGAATGMTATEDLMHMLEGMGYDTGVDLDKLIDCVWMLEKMIGRDAWGHVSRAGPRPTQPQQFFDPNIPFVETLEHARHFKLGPSNYEGCIKPWAKPIESPYLDRVRQGLPAYEPEDKWPWTEDFFPTPASTDPKLAANAPDKKGRKLEDEST